MKTKSLSVLASLMLSSITFADIAVIVHPSVNFDNLDNEQVQRIFLGKTKKFPNGQQAVPINQNSGTPLQNEFNEKVCNKDANQYRAYWSQLIFTGKGTPPEDAGGNSEVLELISKNPNLIGFVDSSAVTASVKVVLKVP